MQCAVLLDRSRGEIREHGYETTHVAFFSVLDHMDILLKDKEIAYPTFVSALFIGR